MPPMRAARRTVATKAAARAAAAGSGGRAHSSHRVASTIAKRRPAAAAGGVAAAAAGARARAAAATTAGAAAAGEAATRSWQECARSARALHEIYGRGFQFPKWTLEALSCGRLDEFARRTVVYHVDDLERVRRVAEEREPVNIAMRRLYDERELRRTFGYSRGAYSLSSRKSLMPNIAIFCRTPCRSSTGQETVLNVINLIGYAFDSVDQPDYKYFFTRGELSDGAKWAELVERMQQVWRYAFECARRQKLRYLYVADVGGGAFSTYLNRSAHTSYAALKEESFPPVAEEYADSGIEVLPLPRIPDWAFTAEGQRRAPESLLVNAWDPWSMVGNGNSGDASLDGYFGRCTAMAVLCWPKTNPFLTYQKL